jgi:ABC-2 type transport system permease protein
VKRIASNLRLFFMSAVISYVALFRWWRPSTYLASKVIMPLAQMLFFVLLGTFGSGMKPDFFVVGNAIQIAAVSGIYGVTMSIGGDRWNGTLPYLFGTPSNRMVMFFGRASVHLVDGFMGVLVAMVWGTLLFRVEIFNEGTGWLLLTVLATTASCSGLGLLMGCVGLITRNVMFVNNAVYFLLLIFSGANIPVEALPFWMRTVSNLLPLTNGIAAARSIIVSDSPDVFLPFLGRECAIGLGWMFLGYFLFRLFEREAKKRGSLETV